MTKIVVEEMDAGGDSLEGWPAEDAAGFLSRIEARIAEDPCESDQKLRAWILSDSTSFWGHQTRWDPDAWLYYYKI